MDKQHKFEAAFLTLVEKLFREQGMNAKDFSEKAFPEQAKPQNKWLRMRKGLNAGKPQQVTLGEAYNIARALNQDLPSLLWRVRKELESQEENEEPAGRKSKKKALS